MDTITKLRFEKPGPEAILSPLEASVLSALWKKQPARVRDLHSIIRKDKPVALTSIAVMLDRLHKKQLVTRSVASGKGGRHYIYSPALSKKDFEYSMVDKVVSKLLDTFGDSAIAYFNDKFPPKKK